MRALSLALLTGCLPEVDRDEMDRVADALSPDAPVLTGHMPVVHGFTRAISEHRAEVGRRGVRLELHGEEDDWVMLAGRLRFDPSDLPEGEWVRLEQSEHSIYACSGPAQDEVWYEQDAHAVQVRRDVRWDAEGQPAHALSVVAGWGTWGAVGAVAWPEVDDAW